MVDHVLRQRCQANGQESAQGNDGRARYTADFKLAGIRLDQRAKWRQRITSTDPAIKREKR
ncbi:hypothetical protein ANCDUO_22844 [Ancylostoma duodenale]|uniref:Uncharacterized protein n=1 Tax=Ancylostoma duodenale TaxID=51022 RepID=A0A0C2FET9_9BILA|nr:hypothetical protein ANCDUO_22844 [Ancylostoma duodenale]